MPKELPITVDENKVNKLEDTKESAANQNSEQHSNTGTVINQEVDDTVQPLSDIPESQQQNKPKGLWDLKNLAILA